MSHKHTTSLDVPWCKQDVAYSCGAAAAQSVLGYYGVRRSERDLMRTLGTEPTYGTHHKPLIELFLAHGLYCYANNDSELDELAHHCDDGIPSIVHYLEPEGDEGHYAVVTGVFDDVLTLHDPWSGPHVRMRRNDFIARWKDERNTFPRWHLAVSREAFSLGKQYRPPE